LDDDDDDAGFTVGDGLGVCVAAFVGVTFGVGVGVAAPFVVCDAGGVVGAMVGITAGCVGGTT